MPNHATGPEIIRSITHGEIDRADGLTPTNLDRIAERSLAHLMPYERDRIVLDALKAHLQEQLVEREAVDDRAPSTSVHAFRGGIPGSRRSR